MSSANFGRNDPLHGITLKALLTSLVEQLGWPELGRRVPLNCFLSNPCINSSLKFLRKTPWARSKVEALYVELQRPQAEGSSEAYSGWPPQGD